jgi:energy-coupling factor transport system ATP-binding protein
MAAISFDALTYYYPDSTRPALDHVELEIAAGSFTVLAGGSASGKSTLIRAACGLVPHYFGGSVAGAVVVAGLDTREAGPAELSAHVGTVTQDPETQVILTTVRAELAFPLENAGHSAQQVARGVEEVALALGIATLLDRSTSELSGGELQRVALGAALARRPDVLLLDEPTSQLDPVAGDELIWLLRRLNEEWGTTVLLAEHRLERCLAAADRVVAMEAGSVVCDQRPQEFIEWAGECAPPLQTPIAAMWRAAGISPAPTGVKAGRLALAERGITISPPDLEDDAQPERRKRFGRRPKKPEALSFSGVWHELRGGPSLLRGVDLGIMPGDRVAIMGRNGAGKSTLLRHAAGLIAPTRGRVESGGRVALLLQDPGAYLLHERVGDEASDEALESVGLAALTDRHPSTLSGGQRQRLALAIVLDSVDRPAVVALDEPTRGMDRADKSMLAERLRGIADTGTAVVVATHDPEFAARCCERVVLLADGRVIADGSAQDLLGGGWYFATEVARVTNGAALLPADGAALLAFNQPRLPSNGPRSFDEWVVGAANEAL